MSIDEQTPAARLRALVRQGCSRRYRVRALVLENFAEIEVARKLPIVWPEISEALGLPASRWQSVQRAFERVKLDYGGNPPAAVRQGEKPAAVQPAQVIQKPSGKNLKIEL
jgi:hypothetical protein